MTAGRGGGGKMATGIIGTTAELVCLDIMYRKGRREWYVANIFLKRRGAVFFHRGQEGLK